MVNVKHRRAVNLVNRKSRTRDRVAGVSAASQTAHERRLAAAQVANKFDDFTAT